MSPTLLLFVMAAASPALPNVQAQGKWQEIGKTSVGNAVYVDPKSVKKSADGIVTATVRVAFVKPTKTPKGPITASRTVAMFDCGRKLVAVKENTYYHDEKTGKVYQHSAAAMPGFGPAIKGTLPDIAMVYLCSK
jgi:surface-adhesin protein E